MSNSSSSSVSKNSLYVIVLSAVYTNFLFLLSKIINYLIIYFVEIQVFRWPNYY